MLGSINEATAAAAAAAQDARTKEGEKSGKLSGLRRSPPFLLKHKAGKQATRKNPSVFLRRRPPFYDRRSSRQGCQIQYEVLTTFKKKIKKIDDITVISADIIRHFKFSACTGYCMF
jgi:hypothetical protein